MNIFVRLFLITIFFTLCTYNGSGSLHAASNKLANSTYNHHHEGSNGGYVISKIKDQEELESTKADTDNFDLSNSKNKDSSTDNTDAILEETLIEPILKPKPIIISIGANPPDISAPNVSKISPLWNKLNTNLRYKAVWKGMKVGVLDATIGFEGNNIYDFKANMSAAGLVGAIIKYKTTTKAKVRLTTNDDLMPITYDHHRTRKKDGRTHIHIKYDNNGKEIKYFMNPPERSGKRPAISTHDRNNVHTIPSMVLNAWKNVIEAHLKAKAAGSKSLNETFTYDFFEGRRKARGIFTTKGYDRKGNIIVVVSLEPLGGFNDKDMRKYNKDGYEVNVLIDPISYKPLTIKGMSNLGNAEARLVD